MGHYCEYCELFIHTPEAHDNSCPYHRIRSLDSAAGEDR
jgi:hypothetical protein